MTNEREVVGEKLKGLALRSIERMQKFIDNPTAEKEEVIALKAAQVGLTSYTRYEQTQSAREATSFMMARELANNNEELANYMRVALPSSSVTKAIPNKT